MVMSLPHLRSAPLIRCNTGGYRIRCICRLFCQLSTEHGGEARRSKPLSYGDSVTVQHPNGKRFMIRLKEDGVFSTHRGSIKHRDIVEQGMTYGTIVNKIKGGRKPSIFRLLRPSFEDIPYFPRSTTPSYPKDCATIGLLLDIRPGHQILEAGTGHGALTTYLSRTVGPTGSVFTLENRLKAWRTLQHTLPAYYLRYVLSPEAARSTSPEPVSQFPSFTVGNISCYYGSIDDRDAGSCREDQSIGDNVSEATQLRHATELLPVDSTFDGIAIDVMEPWTCLQTVTDLLVNDGAIVCFCPNVTQVSEIVNTIQERQLPLWVEKTVETSQRTWDIRPPVSRPSLEPTQHTGFVLQLRRVSMRVALQES
eukprot:gb/GECG01009467.1/.p1 GENE.gb/GECG01009467.1/~~gb/GECG01009467.1/.p1  ORF type:complete len:366 (+),score=19.55 gb/GECG01009467.1/:1-1098(+)